MIVAVTPGAAGAHLGSAAGRAGGGLVGAAALVLLVVPVLLLAGIVWLVDTLNELAASLGDDPEFAASTATALGNRVRVDAAQAFTQPQKQQARDNLDVWSKAEVGDVTTDFVAAFEAALA